MTHKLHAFALLKEGVFSGVVVAEPDQEKLSTPGFPKKLDVCAPRIARNVLYYNMIIGLKVADPEPPWE